MRELNKDQLRDLGSRVSSIKELKNVLLEEFPDFAVSIVVERREKPMIYAYFWHEKAKEVAEDFRRKSRLKYDVLQRRS